MKPTTKRLLFVDDERGIRETLYAILYRHGFTVTLAASVPEALEQIEKQEFDILLCDLNIEREQDGFDVIRAMKKVNTSCATVILTGYPSPECEEQVISLGIDDYIAKPARVDVLIALLAQKLSARQAKLPEQIRGPAAD